MPSLRERLVALLLEEENPAGEKTAPAHAALAPELELVPLTVQSEEPQSGSCPRCRSTLLQPIPNGYRCGQCGHQNVRPTPKGFSRKDLETFDGRPAQFNSPSFRSAVARMMGLDRR